MPNGVVTNGIVPPYPIALRLVPINGFTCDRASFLAARLGNEHTASKAKSSYKLIHHWGNCIFPAEPALSPAGYSWNRN